MARVKASRQVYQSLRAQIISGRPKEGMRLPSEEQLAAEFGVSRATVREALSALDDEGLVLRHHGVGSFVSPHARAVTAGIEKLASFTETLRQHAEAKDEVLEIQQIQLEGDLADRLNAEVGSVGYQVVSLRTVEGVPAIYCVDVMSSAVIPEESLLEQRRNYESLLDFFERELRIRIRALAMTISAVAAQDLVASRLGVERGTPLIHLYGPGFAGTPQPVYYSSNFFRSDRVHLTVVRRR